MKRKYRKSRRGSAMLEALIAALIVATAMAAMVSTWYFSYHMAGQETDKSIAYQLARQTLENIKETGFANTPEVPASSPTVNYYDGNEANQNATPSAARYQVTYTVVSDQLNGNVPAPTALRTVTVTVTSVATGTTLCQVTTYLVRAGI